MLNAEFYKEKIKRLDSSFAVTKDKNICKCSNTQCKDCIFSRSNGQQTGTCNHNRTLWLCSEYEEEPEIDWARVPVDTKILVYNFGQWFPRYFAKYSDNKIHYWSLGSTSFTAESDYNTNTIDAQHAKLFDPEDIEKYKKTPATQNDCCIPIINEPGTRRIRLVKVTDPEIELKKGDLVLMWDGDEPDISGGYVSFRKFGSYDKDRKYPFESDTGSQYMYCMKIEGVRSFSKLLKKND